MIEGLEARLEEHGFDDDALPMYEYALFGYRHEYGDIHPRTNTVYNNLGNLYHGGKGVDNDLAQAFKWWGLAAIQGQPEAVKSLRSLVGRLNNTQVNKGRTLINDFTPLSE